MGLLNEQDPRRLRRRLEWDLDPVANHLGQVLDPADVHKLQAPLKLRQESVTFTEHASLSRPDFNRSQPAIDVIAPFLTDSGLAKLNASGTDVFFISPSKPLSPNEAHNALKRYLLDHFRFSKTFEVYGFLLPLSNANTTNSTWASDAFQDGQLLLNSIATGNGLLRITDVIRWSPVSTQAWSHPQKLSFQRGFLPLLRFYSSDLVVKSTLSHLVNGLYMCIMNNLDSFCEQIEGCMDSFIEARSFKDQTVPANNDPNGSQVIASLAGVFYECLTRFKNSTATYPRLLVMVRRLQAWTVSWIAGISAVSSGFDDPLKDTNPATRDHIITHIRSKVDRLIHIVDREEAKFLRSERRAKNVLSPNLAADLDEGIISALRITYDGPGELRNLGIPRHDNDCIDIQDIRVAPTNKELLCTVVPYLPANLYDAPHHLPNESMERLLDIQFRLLREELTAPLRTSVQLVQEDLMSSKKKTHLGEIMKARGGKYRGMADAQESIMFNVYTGVQFFSLLPDRRGLSVSFSFDSPPGRARAPQPKARKAFWEGMSGKRMMQGGLIALLWKRGDQADVHLGVLASSVKDITESVHADKDRVSARVVFFDPDVELRILHLLKDPASQRDGTAIMVEAPVMFEAIRPFLEALRAEPESIPFGQYLVHRPPGYFLNSGVRPPQYACIPGFAYQLAPLFPHEAGVEDLKLYVNDADSVARVRRELRRSRLDRSQAEAVVDALTREVALIQGPPGTGKSFTGVELLRVLITSAKPILMIAFTNHALDHLMTSVLDAGITDKIVRLGGRSADERIKKFSIEELEVVAGRSRLDASFARNHRDLKDVEGEIKNLMKAFTQTQISSDAIAEFLQTQYPEHFEHILFPPRWISTIHALSAIDDAGWQKIGKRPNDIQDSDNTKYAFWLRGRDLEFLARKEEPPKTREPPPPTKPLQENKFALLQGIESAADEDDEDHEEEPWQLHWGSLSADSVDMPVSADQRAPIDWHPAEKNVPPPRSPSPAAIDITDLQDPALFFAAHDCATVPQIPASDRPLDILLGEGDMWSFSLVERQRLHAYWVQCVRESLQQNHLDDFESLRKKYTRVLEIYNQGKNETRRQLLQNVDIVGCTTTGAAKLTTLLKGLGPRIMLVEEAGQVLEAHILGSLVPSVEHLILIGDPLQLRPTLNNYSLSVESKRGNQLFKFDMSLMERLSSTGFPMSQIDVQRRMRPAISSLIRNTLYPNLVDHDHVKDYPNVRGFAKNVFFLSHSHRENEGAEESSSKYNIYEVEMIRDLVLFLLRQGCYSQEGDIVVLCAYLGQLARVRDALADLVAVVIDERDQAELADQEGEQTAELLEDSRVEHVKISRRVLIITFLNERKNLAYMTIRAGEEAKIIILSLVRNAGSAEDGRLRQKPTIGFLKD
ncbi:hypothetical protein D9615_004617 [Tricholomella constricta]|uniref:Uncharacterized protein n=1 Tax=Tricholomella constricta TaxID=117010 RepID=A0A8H5HCC2_9AGAR|nr:hypothetical protein D9615_004617 [Tricholomella constricta]